MEALVIEQEDVLLCKINIQDWDSEVSEQFDLETIPRLLLYRGSTLVAEGTSEVMSELSNR